MWWPKLTGCATCRWVKPGRIASAFASASVQQGLLQVHQQAGDQVDLVAQPQAHVGGDLVVAAAAGVQALAGIAHQLREARLDVQVHVLQIQLPVEPAGFDVLRDLRHPALDGGQVLARR